MLSLNAYKNNGNWQKTLSNCMPSNYKQGTLYPTYDSDGGFDKPYVNRHEKNAGHVRKAGQTKLRRQLKKELKELFDELENELADSYGGEGTTAFEAGKEYLIMICQYSGYGDYTLNIE